jgi:hypothetical protein
MTVETSPSMARHAWLERATHAARLHMAGCGYTVPGEVRVSIGWPKGSHGKGKAIGQCWSKEASEDAHAEIFISPALGVRNGADPSLTIVGVIVHELAHAFCGHEAGHKGPFKQCALAVGLEGKMTATTPGPAVVALAEAIVREHGPFPAGALNERSRKVQGTRMLKCQCATCGYIAYTTAKWLEAMGAPICPGTMPGDDESGAELHGPMTCATSGEGEG